MTGPRQRAEALRCALESEPSTQPVAADFPCVALRNGLVPLDAVLCTEELTRRSARPPDYETESRALVLLVQALADSPQTILQTLADTILESFQVGSAGVSLLASDEKRFFWPAIAGVLKIHIGGGTPRDFGPCGDVLDLDAPLLFKHPERRYSYLRAATPRIEECLMLPFYLEGKVVGTIWAVTHDMQRQFDAEDLRQLTSLGRFASAAYHAGVLLEAALEQGQVARSLMEDAVKARLAIEKLRESEEHYRMRFESIDEGFCIIEKLEGERLDFRYVEANPAFAAQTGLRDVVGKTLRQVLPDAFEEQLSIYDAVSRTGEPIKIQRQFGSQGRILELYAFRVNDPAHRRVAINLQDITERKKAEEKLARQAAELAALYATAPVGLFMFDADLRYLRVNQTMADLNGLPAEQYVGRTLREVLTADLADDVEPLLRRVLETGRPLLNQELYGATIHRPGELRYWLVSCHPVQADNGVVRGVHGAVQEITERKQAERLLRQNRDTFFNLIENAPFGLYVVDAQFRLRQVSTAAQKVFNSIRPLVGRDFEEILRLVWTDSFVSEALARFRHTLQTGEPYAAPDTTLQRQDTADIESYDWKIERVTLPDGQFGVVCYFYDITQRKQAEQALRESQNFLRSSLDALSGHIAVLDESGTILEINAAWQQFANENQYKGPSIGVNYFEHCNQTVLKGGEIPAYAQGINDVIARRRTHFEMEYSCHSPTEKRWFVMRVTRFQGPGPVRIVIVHNDCTERKLAQDASRESEARFRNLFNSMDEGYCIIEMMFDEHEKPVDYRFLEVNPSFEKQSGMHDVTGKRVRELIPDLEPHWFETYGEVALTGRPVRFISEVKALDRWLDIHAARLGGPENRQVVVIFDNVTERMKADEALRQSEARFRVLFDDGPVAIYSCDTSGMILEFNPCAVQLWGRAPRRDDVDERFFGPSRIYRPDGSLMTQAQNPVLAVLRGKIPQARDVEAVIERPDGSRITVIANIVPLKNSRGEITGAINCFYDITERSRLEQKTQEQAQALAELHQRKDEFLAMLSHELRNPLAPLTSAVQLLQLQKNEDPLRQQACNVIERQVGQLRRLVEDLLEVSRITNGSVRLRKERISVGDIVQRALETTRPLIAQYRHELTVSLPPEPIWLQADATRLEQVLVNLLTNAAKYTDEGGRIWLSVEQQAVAGAAVEPQMAVLRVRDSGIGIAPELLPRIFDLFTQAERSIDRAQGGLGIGLCLVQRLVHLHGGTVKAFSVPGQGSEFVVRLPVAQGEAPPPLPPPPSIAPAQPPGKGCRVLAVDDNVDAVQSMAMLLKMCGHEVQIAYDGPSALESALAMRPDVVLLDIGLPGLTGYEVAERIRQEAALRNTVLVALTGYGRETDLQFSKDAGFDYHLVKPADFREVERILAIVSRQTALPGG